MNIEERLKKEAHLSNILSGIKDIPTAEMIQNERLDLIYKIEHFTSLLKRVQRELKVSLFSLDELDDAKEVMRKQIRTIEAALSNDN